VIRIKIEKIDTFLFTGTSNRTGKPFSIPKQVAYAVLPNEPYPIRIELNLEEKDKPYEVGEYRLGPESFYVDRFRKLTLGKPQLVPVSAKVAA
jgi:hypothetical protein